jgi:diketogulonate reductase-like aldo/keto reductase
MVAAAIKVGCHHIETACMCNNEKVIDQGIPERAIDREQLFMRHKPSRSARRHES